ncbi:DEAD/DEAH box helicase [Sporomusa termitida]|uniref:SNF2-related protein n=1 Tax=Sporomusa termitida TaxID=2377 RepID=UPI001B8664E0|nr:DEAD/DEAH box helicase [Sporomusa termitida]
MTRYKNRVAYYLDMGLGKTFVAGEKAKELDKPVLVVCQKSKINDWKEHFQTHYEQLPVSVINYDLAWRRSEYLNWADFTLILDESSLIKNETAKRTKYVLHLKPANVILLSGTPTGGKYEELWSQCRLLGWNISKKLFYEHYIITEKIEVCGFPLTKVVGYKNVDRLKAKLRQYGAVFMKTEEVFDLPERVETVTKIKATKEYRQFKRDRYLALDSTELVGDTPLKKLLYQRQLCGQFNKNKLSAMRDLLDSNNDRVIVFYNFTAEFDLIKTLTDRPISYINGAGTDLANYETYSNSITCVQYTAGAMGHNLQRSNIIIYFTLPLSSELFEQSKKRIHRIGQNRTCFYYYPLTEKSVEEKILKVLKQRRDFTDALFKEEAG